MHLQSLKIFCDVVRHHSFSRGAAENRVTQSSASQTIHQLERRLGVALVDRSRRPWKLTAEGKVFFDGSVNLLDRAARLEQEVRRYHAEVSAVVRVAAIYSVGLGPMNDHLQRFMADHPGTRVQIEYLHPDRVVERVQEETADLGIVSYPHARRELSVVPWREEAMVLVCPPSHRLAKTRTVPPAEIDGETFVGFDRGLGIRLQVDRFLKRRGVSVHVPIEFDNVEAIKRAVEVGSGISILPRPTLERELTLGTLRAVPFTGPRFVRPLGIIHRRGKRLCPRAEQFIQMLRRQEAAPARRRAAAGRHR